VYFLHGLAFPEGAYRLGFFPALALALACYFKNQARAAARARRFTTKT
jgi:hypothetical protein